MTSIAIHEAPNSRRGFPRPFPIVVETHHTRTSTPSTTDIYTFLPNTQINYSIDHRIDDHRPFLGARISQRTDIHISSILPCEEQRLCGRQPHGRWSSQAHQSFLLCNNYNDPNEI